MPNNQLNQTFQTMRTIINNLKQAEQYNVNVARQLAGQEASNANILNAGPGGINTQQMANLEAQAVNILNHFENAERNAVQQLNQLDQLVADLQNQLG